MRRALLLTAIMATFLSLTVIPAYAQQTLPKQMVLAHPWVGHFGVTLDKEGSAATFSASDKDTSQWISWWGSDYVIDSLHYVISTPDTARYRLALLFRESQATPTAAYKNYKLSSGLGLDTLSATTAAINDGRIPMSVVPFGTGQIALVMQFSAAGNHLGITNIATKKYSIAITAFYKGKRIILNDTGGGSISYP